MRKWTQTEKDARRDSGLAEYQRGHKYRNKGNGHKHYGGPGHEEHGGKSEAEIRQGFLDRYNTLVVQ